MESLKLRFRDKEGKVSPIRPPAAEPASWPTTQTSLGDLLRALQKQTGSSQLPVIKSGFPPKPVVAPLSTPLAQLGLQIGEVLVVEQPTAGFSYPADPIAVSPLVEPQSSGSSSVSGSNNSNEASELEQIPAFTGEEGHLVRRVVDADNSCLFNSIGYVLQGRKRTGWSDRLRKVIAEAVTKDPFTYSEVVLGQSPQHYQQWILQNTSWGGAIELSILAKHFRCELAVVDTMSGRFDIYGQDEGFNQRAYLVYDGIHYDPLGLELAEGLPDDCDVTLFNPLDPHPIEQAMHLAQQAREQRQFTDTSSFTLRCLVCQKGFVGQEQAVAHATSTGHQNFSEY